MYIYSITNKINGKQYVGLTTKTVKHRWSIHQRSIDLLDCALHRAMRKYGLDNFSVETIEKVNGGRELLCEREVYWIDKLQTFSGNGGGYNMTLGGEGMSGYEHTDETRRKISESRKGITHDEETKRKIGEANKGNTPSDEAKRKMSEAAKGNTIRRGSKHNDEAKRKMSEAAKNRLKYSCVHCGEKASVQMLSRWHNDNCKEKPNAA